MHFFFKSMTKLFTSSHFTAFLLFCFLHSAYSFQGNLIRCSNSFPVRQCSLQNIRSGDNRMPLTSPTCQKKGFRQLECRAQKEAVEVEVDFSQGRITNQVLVMATCGAILGPCLDGYHSAFGVLAYTRPISIDIAGLHLFQTDFWVPPMFALAAIILGLSYPYLDRAFNVPSASRLPTAPSVFLCISFFSFQYYLSGLFFAQGCSPALIHAILASTATANWAIFDRTATGAVMSVVTGLAGPLVEIGLLNAAPALVGGALYHYTAPGLLGIPTWIAWVYACGAPAVGNLSRLFWRRP